MHDPSFDLAEDRHRVERLPDVLGGVDVHDPNQAEFRVDVHDHPVGGDREACVDPALSGGVGRLGGGVAVAPVALQWAVGEQTGEFT
mgnify:CR=1 FL=1